ncbi:uncharacterized protein [Salminus brasiliensis]|uniref:uncharacterized protein n=1 Tax=Salminus brasiliensis TaxID=930266 RepID=UPI003B83284F
MTMPLVLHCSAVLLLLMILSSPEKQGSEARVSNCCLKTSKTIVRLDLLKRYKEQKKPLCPVNALIFTTKKDVNICSDPSSPWAIRAKNFLDKKNQHPVKHPQELSPQTTALKPEAWLQSNSTTTNRTPHCVWRSHPPLNKTTMVREQSKQLTTVAPLHCKMKLHLAVGFLCFVALSSTFAQNGRPSHCCLKISSIAHKVRLDKIVDYWWQIKGVCPITAVVLKTRLGKRLCADPNIDWTKRAMSKVDTEKARTEGEKNKDAAALTPVPPAEGNREGAPTAAAANTPLKSQLQESAVSAAPRAERKEGGSAKPVKAPRGSKRRGKGGRKRKIKSKVGKKKGKRPAKK